MKTATIPSTRVEPELGESLSQFAEACALESLRRQQNQSEFIARGMASLDRAKTTGDYVDADVAVGKLARKLSSARRDPQKR